MKLSVITINYNNRDGLRKTVESVVNQTWRNFEYIVIDGGSIDGSTEVINEYTGYIDYWVSESDRGIYHAMNKGIDIANGDYCIFMNSGDYFYDSEVLTHIVPHLNNYDVICGNTSLSNGSYKKAVDTVSLLYFYEKTLNHQSTFIKTENLKKYHYDESLNFVADWKFWLQSLILDNGTYKSINVLVANYDVEGYSALNRERCNKEREQVLNEMFSPKILIDYLQFTQGKGYKETNYDKLFLKVRKYNYAPIIYSISLLIVRIISFFKPSAKFARELPFNIVKDENIYR